MKNRLKLAVIAGIMLSPAMSVCVQAAVPIVTDSRIKTFVYNENVVFAVLTHYGYQSNIELGGNEEIETVSVGDRVGWQIVPAGRRLFIRAMEEGAHTNMTVVTNKRAYQFDLRSSSGAALAPTEELVYVVRFYYPDEPDRMPPAPVVNGADISGFSASAPVSQPVASQAPMPMQTAPVPAPALQPTAAAAQVAPRLAAPIASAMNYNYTFEGPSTSAPLKIYDDGRSTYFKLRSPSERPQVAVITASGEEMSIPTNVSPDGIATVSVIAPRFAIKNNGARVVVYNENLPGA